MDTYWKLMEKAVRNDNLERLQCLLTGYQNETLQYQRDNRFNVSDSCYSKDMCYVNRCPVVKDYDEIQQRTLLHLAVSKHSPEAVQFLLQHGANPNTFHMKIVGSTLLFALNKFRYLVKACNSKLHASKLKEIINLLIEFDADLYNLTPDGLSFLHDAVTNKYDIFNERFEIILSRTCFNINYQIPVTGKRPIIEYDTGYSEGDTALHVLARRKSGVNSQICKVLLYYGIHPNVRNINGCTALHYALGKREIYTWPYSLMDQHIMFIQLLLEHGASLDILDFNNNSPMAYYYKNVIKLKHLQQAVKLFETTKQILKSRMDIFCVMISGGAMTRRSLKEVSSLKPVLKRNFEYMILTFYTHTWLFETLVDIRYPFQFINKMSEHYQLYSITQSLKRLSAMVLYSNLKPNVWCGIKKLQVPASLRDYVTLGRIDILFSNTCEATYCDKYWQDICI